MNIQISKNFTLKYPLYNASGCWCTFTSELQDLYKSQSAAVVTKSCTILPRDGNLVPRLQFEDEFSYNSMGIPNHGYKYYMDQRHEYPDKPYIISIFPFSEGELHTFFENVDNAIFEVNLSCGNVDMIPYSFDLVRFESFLNILSLLKKNNTVGLKLPPYHMHEIGPISTLLNRFVDTIDYIVLINSVQNCLVLDNNNKNIITSEYGSIGGSETTKAISLALVKEFYQVLDKRISIIGCGGIKTRQDVEHYLSVGAKACQVGTELLIKGPSIFKINNDFKYGRRPTNAEIAIVKNELQKLYDILKEMDNEPHDCWKIVPVDEQSDYIPICLGLRNPKDVNLHLNMSSHPTD